MNYSYSGWEPKPLFDNLLNPDPRDLKRHSISEDMDSELIGRSSGEYPTAEPVNHPTAGQLWVDTQTGKTYAYVDSAGKVLFKEDYHWRMQREPLGNKVTDIAEYGKHCTLRMKRYEQMVSPAAVLLSTKVPNLIKRLMKKG